MTTTKNGTKVSLVQCPPPGSSFPPSRVKRATFDSVVFSACYHLIKVVIASSEQLGLRIPGNHGKDTPQSLNTPGTAGKRSCSGFPRAVSPRSVFPRSVSPAWMMAQPRKARACVYGTLLCPKEPSFTCAPKQLTSSYHNVTTPAWNHGK